MRAELAMGRATVIMTVTTLQTDVPVPAEEFQVPAGVVVIEMGP